jgi:hypothetical protein
LAWGVLNDSLSLEEGKEVGVELLHVHFCLAAGCARIDLQH